MTRHGRFTSAFVWRSLEKKEEHRNSKQCLVFDADYSPFSYWDSSIEEYTFSECFIEKQNYSDMRTPKVEILGKTQ